MRSLVETIPDGTPGVAVKMRRLRSLVDRAKANPNFRAVALRLVAGVPERDWTGELAAVSDYVRRLRYTRDPAGVELFTDPVLLAGAIDASSPDAAGDCDDHAALGAALLESLGHETRFRVAGYDSPDGAQWAHIWHEVRHPTRGWVAIDDTAKGHPVGWSPASRFEVTMDSSGLGSLRSSLKHAAKQVARPVERIAAPVTKPAGRALAPVGSALRRASAPLAPVLAPVVNPRALLSQPGRVVAKSGRAIARPIVGAQKFAGSLFTDTAKAGVRLTAPGWGSAVDTVAPGAGAIVDRLAQDAGLISAPTGNPLVDNAPGGAFWSPDDAGNLPWYVWAGIAGAALFFLTRRGSRRR